MSEHHMPKNVVTSLPDQAKMREEAGAWLVRLDRGLDQREQDDLKVWLSTSEAHRRYLHKLASTWDAMGMLETLREMFPLLHDVRARGTGEAGPAGGHSRWWYTLAASAALIVLVAGTLMLSPLDSRLPEARQALATIAGQQTNHVLPDGSRIVLNTRSRVEADFNRRARIVRVYEGEVGFEVAHEVDRPFIVYAGRGLVSAVGTAFSVRVKAGGVDVIVTEGRVGVISNITEDPRAEQLMMPERFTGNDRSRALISAGHGVRFEDVIESIEPLDAETLERKQAWRQGALIFKGEPLEEVLAEVGRYTDQQLVITDPSIRRVPVGGHFRTSDINTLVALLADNFDLDIKVVNSNLIHLSARTPRAAGGSNPINDSNFKEIQIE